MVAIIDNRYH